jgi:ribonuclease III
VVIVSLRRFINDMLRDQFRDTLLYDLAMTHRGVHGEYNNQRLEFLGDRVLGLIVADMLYGAFPEAREGDLAKRQAALVCGETLSDVAERIGLGAEMILSDSELGTGGRGNVSNLEDVCEALIGALYLDRGLEAARAFVLEHWTPLLVRVTTPPKDAKTALQEWAQSQGLPLPDYRELERSGPAHAPAFTIEVCVEGYVSGVGTATSKRAAEQSAARALLEAQGIASEAYYTHRI